MGVIGTGIMGADHLNILHFRVTGATVTMVADLDLDLAREVAAALPDVRVTDDGLRSSATRPSTPSWSPPPTPRTPT